MPTSSSHLHVILKEAAAMISANALHHINCLLLLSGSSLGLYLRILAVQHVLDELGNGKAARQPGTLNAQ